MTQPLQLAQSRLLTPGGLGLGRRGMLHEEARPYGVRVTCVAPGYTPSGFQERGGLSSTAGQPSFMLTSADFVARVALDAVESGRALVVPGLMNAISARILGLLPSGLQRRAGAFASKFTR